MNTNHLEFQKSSYSGNRQNCVEVAEGPTSAAIRDSMHPAHGALYFHAPEWQAFVTAVRQNEL